MRLFRKINDIIVNYTTMLSITDARQEYNEIINEFPILFLLCGGCQIRWYWPGNGNAAVFI